MANQYPPNLPQFPKLELNPAKLAPLLLIPLLLLGVMTSVYQVPTEGVAVVQRFGAFHSITDPGLRFKLPFGVDKKTIIETERQQKMEFGFGSPGATNAYQFAGRRGDQEAEKNMITGDQNAAVVEWVVQYRINNAEDYLFKFRDPPKTLRDLSEAVMREAVGDRTIDEVLTVGRQEIESQSVQKLQEAVNQLNVGIQIDQVQLLNVNPPPPVQSSFDEVNRAQQEREQLINKANGEYNQSVPRARGEAEQKISAAQGYASKRINEAEGDAARFTSQLTEYEKAPDVTKKRLYLETIQEVLSNIPNKVILDESAPQFLPMLNLNADRPGSAMPDLSPANPARR
jgi:membrane protease subunit HflK